jgi:hypothetical protein
LVRFEGVEVVRSIRLMIVYRIADKEITVARSRVQPGSVVGVGERGRLVLPVELAGILARTTMRGRDMRRPHSVSSTR